jgi:glycosyltransferase involved in cell wall biosynthesis
VKRVQERASKAWGEETTTPRIAVLIATYGRRAYLTELVRALEAQRVAGDDFEVVIVDDASPDGSWDVLLDIVGRTDLRLLVVRHNRNRGPAAARNTAAGRSRAAVLAFTDDDCLPTPTWLPSILAAFDRQVDIVQGAVNPSPDELEQRGPWDHTIWVQRPSPFFETCNVAYRRQAFEGAGGFDDSDPLLTPEMGRGFGEDADLGWRVLRGGGRRTFSDAALVHHRFVPGDFRRWIQSRRHTVGFPGLARRTPLVARWLRGRVFLTRESAAFDAAIASMVMAAALRRAWPLLAAVPWLRLRWSDSLTRTRGDRSRAAVVLAQHGVSDLVTLVSLMEGSVRYRQLVL